MKFQLCGAWPVGGGRFLIPAGTILDSTDWQWAGEPLPLPPPINAAAMDQAAYNTLRQYYPANRILVAGEGIVTA